MIDLNEIKLDVSTYAQIEDMVIQHANDNAGCDLHPHWIQSCRDDINRIQQTGKFEALNWLGDGFPKKTLIEQPFADWSGFKQKFANIDTLDVQSGMYQFYQVANLIPNFYKLKRIKIIEVGGGYGRLAMFFLAHFGEACQYINIDYVPTSLCFSSQVIRQAFPMLRVADALDLSELEQANYVSLPAWEMNRLTMGYNLGVNIHSFQEMTKPVFQFYIDFLTWRCAFIYSVNNPHESTRSHQAYDYGPLREIFRKPYPFGANWEEIYGSPCLERGFKL